MSAHVSFFGVFFSRNVWFLPVTQSLVLSLMMGKPYLPPCCPWDDNRSKEMLMTVWADGIQVDLVPKRNLLLLFIHLHAQTHTQSAMTMLMPGPLWMCLALMWMGTCSAHSLFTCEPIEVHRCLGMPYNMTFFPNMMDHYDQDIAAANMEVSPPSWYPIWLFFWVFFG